MASGKYDADIRARARRYAELSKPVIVTFNHEPHNDNTGTPGEFAAARGLGMSGRQVLFRVEVPLAAPVIIRGVRLATVMVVGTATLATPVGGLSLGNYIFGGLQSLNHLATVLGCVLAETGEHDRCQLRQVADDAVRSSDREDWFRLL